MASARGKPTVLKDLHGSTTRRNLDEPVPVGNLSDNITAYPHYFTPDQMAEWEYVLEHSPPGMLKRIDLPVLEAYIVAVCLHRRAVTEFGDSPLLIDHGPMKIPHPLLRVIREQGETARKKANDLGFTPISRPRINANGPALGATLNSVSHARPKDAPQQSLAAYLASAPGTAVN